MITNYRCPKCQNLFSEQQYPLHYKYCQGVNIPVTTTTTQVNPPIITTTSPIITSTSPIIAPTLPIIAPTSPIEETEEPKAATTKPNVTSTEINKIPFRKVNKINYNNNIILYPNNNQLY